MIWIIEAKYEKGYKITLKFNDGTTGTVDLEETIVNDNRKLFAELKDLDKFKNSKLIWIPSFGRMDWIWPRNSFSVWFPENRVSRFSHFLL